MTDIGFYIPYITGVLTVIVSFGIGFVAGTKETKTEQHPRVIVPPLHIPPAREPRRKKPTPPPPPKKEDFGPVERPTAEELEKEDNPVIKGEEEEMEKSLEEIFGNPEDVQAMFAHKRKYGISTIFKKGQYAI